MAKYDIPDKLVAIVKSFHEGMMARVLDERESSETFRVTNGVKQGCVLAPTLFSVVFSAMLKTAFQDDTDSMTIRYRTDGKLFNLRRLQARGKVKEERMRDILFADDCALNASSEDEMQRNMDKFESVCDAVGLIIKKTEVMFQPAPYANYSDPTVTVKGQKLPTVGKFTYFGSTLYRNVLIDDEVDDSIVKASTAIRRLCKNV